MDYKYELKKLQEKQEQLIKQAEKCGYVYDAANNTFKKDENQIYVIHITINSLGAGESLGHFEIYDKVFEVTEEFALNAAKVTNLDDFMDEVLFKHNWDDDFIRCLVFEHISLSDWFYHTTDESHFDEYENIATFRFKYIDEMMGNVTIMRCNSKILTEHKGIYHCTENYVFEQ